MTFPAARAAADTTWHNVYSFNAHANAYLRTLSRGTHVFVEANYELRDLPSAEEGAPRKRQVFLRHGTFLYLKQEL